MQEPLTVGAAARETGWSARMLRYLEENGLVAPHRTASGYRLYGLSEVNRLRSLRDLRRRFGLELAELAFARAASARPGASHRGRRLPRSRRGRGSWVEWEQRKHERLLVA